MYYIQYLFNNTLTTIIIAENIEDIIPYNFNNSF